MKKSINTFLVLLIFINYSSLCQQIDSEKLSRIKDFNTLYGQVKYFHPSDEAAELDWDAFAIYGVKTILESEEENFKNVLEKLFLPIAPNITFSNQTISSKIVSVKSPSDSTITSDTIRWQHFGNGNFNSAGYYKSLRTNRKRKLSPSGFYREDIQIDFPLDFKIGPGNYKYEFYVKCLSMDAFHQAKVSLCKHTKDGDSSCEVLGTTRTQKWLKIKRSITFKDSIKSINLKVTSYGKGSIYIDNLVILDAKEKKVLSNIDWETKNSEHFSRGKNLYQSTIKKNVGLKGSYALEISSLEKLIKDSTLFHRNNTNDYSYLKLNSNLTAEMPLFVLNDFQSPASLTKKKSTSDFLGKIKNLRGKYENREFQNKLEFKLGGLISVWNSVKYFYPYFQDIDHEWIDVFDIGLNLFANDSCDISLETGIRSILAYLEDGHSNFEYINSQIKYCPGINLDFIEGKVYLVSALQNFKKYIGLEVLEINDHKVDDLLEDLLELQPRNGHQRSYSFATKELLLGKLNSSVKVKLRSIQGKVTSKVFKRNYLNTYISSLPTIQKKKNFEEITKETRYIDLVSFNPNEFRNNIENIVKSKNLILDLRGYPTSNSTDIIDLIGHFFENSISQKWMFVPEIMNPEDIDSNLSFSKFGWNIVPKKPYLDQNVYFLINYKAISYSESIIGYFDRLENVSFIGSPTAGANGSSNSLSFLNEYKYSYTGTKVLKHDGSRLHGIGFLPDVEVRPTIQGIIDGRDEVLEKAIELASENK